MFISDVDQNYVAIFLNLTKSPDGPMWGDGTLHESTEAFKKGPKVVSDHASGFDVYTIWKRNIDDYKRSHPMHYMCQNNPFDFE